MKLLTLESIFTILTDSKLGLIALHSLVLSTAPGGVKMVELAVNTKTTTANMTGTVDRLEKFGLVERHRDVYDRRIVLVSATDKGKDLVSDYRDKLEQAQR